MQRIETLETKQESLDTENAGLKDSLDFAYGRIDDLEKREKEQIESIQKAQKDIDEIKSENTKLKVEAVKNKEKPIVDGKIYDLRVYPLVKMRVTHNAGTESMISSKET